MTCCEGGGGGGGLMRGIKNTSVRLCAKNAGGLMREGICRTLRYVIRAVAHSLLATWLL